MRRQVKLSVQGMSCEGCAKRIERQLLKEKGVLAAEASLEAAEVQLIIDPKVIRVAKILQSRVFAKPFRVRGWNGGWWTERYTARVVAKP